MGRQGSSVRINAGSGYVVGVDIGGSNLRVALADMKGTLLDKWSASTKRTSSPAMVIEQIRDGVDCLLKKASVSRRSLLAVAAGAPGGSGVCNFVSERMEECSFSETPGVSLTHAGCNRE